MASAPPAQAPVGTLDDFRMAKLQQLAQQHEIRSDWIVRLRQLENFCITLLCDDSGSMATLTSSGGSSAGNPYARQITRWDELRNTVSILVQLVTALDPSGCCDIYFLNRPPMLGVSDAAQVQVAFARPPQGFTPLTRALMQIVHDKAQALAERKLLLIIATDGQPTDDGGNARIPEFLQALMQKPPNMLVWTPWGLGVRVRGGGGGLFSAHIFNSSFPPASPTSPPPPP